MITGSNGGGSKPKPVVKPKVATKPLAVGKPTKSTSTQWKALIPQIKSYYTFDKMMSNQMLPNLDKYYSTLPPQMKAYWDKYMMEKKALDKKMNK